MRRRAFIGGGVAVVAAPVIGRGQPSERIYRVGSLTRGGRQAAAPYNRVLEERLAALGWVEGRNIVFEHRYADLSPERYPELAAELVRVGVDIVVAPSTPAAVAMRRATTKIPIVMTVGVDPVGATLAASLARPGGNVTGLTIETGPELGAKLLQLLKEAVPSTTRVAVLGESSVQALNPSFAAAMTAASTSLGLSLLWVEVRGPADLDRALATALRERSNALVVMRLAMAITHARPIAAFAARNRLATIARTREFAEAGGLIAYSTDILDLYARAAVYVDKILKGAKPGDLPIEQPTKFELAMNLKTAAAIGLTLPPPLLVRADRIIE
jgi:putative ABC transport system substrate-binding protein